MEKICARCKEKKNLDDFYVMRRRGNEMKGAYCKRCSTECAREAHKRMSDSYKIQKYTEFLTDLGYLVTKK